MGQAALERVYRLVWPASPKVSGDRRNVLCGHKPVAITRLPSPAILYSPAHKLSQILIHTVTERILTFGHALDGYDTELRFDL